VAKSEANNTILRGRNSPTGRHFVPHKSNRKYRRRNTYPNTSSFLTLRGGISRYPRCLYSCFVGSTKTKYCFRRDAVVRVAQCDYYRGRRPGAHCPPDVVAERVLLLARTSPPRSNRLHGGGALHTAFEYYSVPYTTAPGGREGLRPEAIVEGISAK
jgi:hypothetical protein